MIISFNSNTSKNLIANINGNRVEFRLPKNEWCIVENLVDTKQIINYLELQKDSGFEIYSGSWKKEPPFGDASKITVMKVGANNVITTDQKTFSGLLLTNNDAIAELSNKHNLVGSSDNLLNRLGDKLDYIFENNTGEVLRNLALEAQKDYYVQVQNKVDNYLRTNFSDPKFLTILTALTVDNELNNCMAPMVRKLETIGVGAGVDGQNIIKGGE